MRPVLLLDLDDTLMVEEPAAAASFAAVASYAAGICGVDPDRLAPAARRHARKLWHAAPTIEYCERVGISSWEGLWCRFEAHTPEARLLRGWAPSYRRDAWRLALSDQGIDDLTLAIELGDRFGIERRSRHRVFEGVAQVLAVLQRSHSLVLVTNGAACLQREKLAASGLGGHFEEVVVSEDVGIAKPAAAVFEYALSKVGADPEEAVMVGDSLIKDVDGALGAGIRAIWLNRDRVSQSPSRQDLVEIATLDDLPKALALDSAA